jgi:sulfide:quinone oxidoreductase
MPDIASPTRVLVAGGGIAALEAVLALRALGGDRLAVELLAPGTAFAHRPSSVRSPFSGELAPEISFDRAGAVHHRGTLAEVDAERHTVTTTDGGRLRYDRLLVATGARPIEAVGGATLFRGPISAGAVEGALRHARGRVVFTLGEGTDWTLAVYELALLAAHALPKAHDLMIVTHERRPLELFGSVASDAVARLLDRAGIEFRGETIPESVVDGALLTRGGGSIAADVVIALPKLEPPAIAGLPAGFLEIDEHARVVGVPHVYAAGDVTAGAVKQGGLATQQADTVAEVLAAACGAPVRPKPFRPILRGLLLTGGAPVYLRSTLDASGSPQPGGVHARRVGVARPSGEASTRALWWPPGKIAGRYLAPLLATTRPSALTFAPMVERSRRGMAAVPTEGREDALALTLLLADQDAAIGDFAQALHALDAAAALGGGILPGEYVGRREEWLAALGKPPPPG